MNDAVQLDFAERALTYELGDLDGRHGYDFSNTFFGPADAAGLYTMIREHQPTTVLEIGSGMSTRVALSALEDNGRGRLITVEPFEHDRMPHRPDFDVPIQQLPLSTFDQLGENDILFIDSSHVVALGSDVAHLVLRVLPRLQRGVLVHFHDIFLPDEYPAGWARELRRFWTEQYLVHAFLLFNTSFEILWSSHYLSVACGYLERWPPPATAGGSLWLRRTA